MSDMKDENIIILYQCSVTVDSIVKSDVLAYRQCLFSYYDVAVIQWITSCHKNCMNTSVITLWRIDVTSLTMRFLAEIMLILWAIKSHLMCHMINRILHSWSFHMK